MSASHPAYPTTAETRRHNEARRLADREHTNNARIRAILIAAILKIKRTCDVDGHSMAPGYNLRDIPAALEDMLPLVDDHEQIAALEAWAWEQADAGVVS